MAFLIINEEEVNQMQEARDIYEMCQNYSTIIIQRHVNPDEDALGSQLGLKDILQHAFPEKRIYAVGKNSDRYSWIGTMDQIEDDVYQDALVIILDCGSLERIDDERYQKARQIIKIDHHPAVDRYGNIQAVYPDASSVSELIADLVNDLPDQLSFSKEAASALYAGIIGDTGRFLYPATSQRTFEVASQLLSYQIDLATIGRKDEEITPAVAKLMGNMLAHLEVDDCGAAYYIITQDLLTSLGLKAEDAGDVVAMPGQLTTVKAWLLFVEDETGKYRVHLRSKGPKINQLALKHHGGGHELASGATVEDLDEVHVMIKELKELLQ